jgi:hypothetical protein
LLGQRIGVNKLNVELRSAQPRPKSFHPSFSIFRECRELNEANSGFAILCLEQ